MTTDDRPSIAELQQLERELEDAEGVHLEARRAELLYAVPDLLEIAAAAPAWAESDDEDRAAELDALLAAIAKVRR